MGYQEYDSRTGPEVFTSPEYAGQPTSGLEVGATTGATLGATNDGLELHEVESRRSRRWIWIVIAAVMPAVIALAVDLGVGLTRKSGQSNTNR